MRLILSFLVVVSVLIGCKNNEDETSLNSSIMTVKMPTKSSEAAESDVAIEVSEDKVEVDQVKFVRPVIAEEIQPKIIKSGDLRFETNNLETTYNQIQAAVKKHNANIQNDSEGKDFESLFRHITVRVPSQHFDNFLADISKGVGYFDRKEISSQDVTEEYIDIQSRLKTKKVLETRYLELLKKANKVSEMLEIETQLSEIREEIEAKEGQLKYMQSRVSMSTVTIEFYKRTAEESGVTVSYGTKIWNAIKSGFNGISSFFIGLLQVWPFIIILVVALYFIRKRFKKKKQ